MSERAADDDRPHEPGFERVGAPAAPSGPPAAGVLAALWQRLLSRVPMRLDPGHRAAIAIGLAVVAAAAVTGVWLVAERPRAVAVSETTPDIPGASSPLGSADPPAPPSDAGVPAAQSGSPALVVVDVAGKVRRPGLYRLPSGSRVDDAVKAAGGALNGVDLTSLNLAAKVGDGQQIVVGLPGAGAGGGPVAAGPTSGATAAAGPVDLNTATLDQLESLPGVGPVLGQQILDWRTEHGGFTSVSQLNDVVGIGAVKYSTLSPLVTV